MVLENFRVGQILTGFHIQTQLKISLQTCAQLCFRVPQCMSFDYCESRKCQLNSGDEFSQDAVFGRFDNCQYMGMKRNDLVVCKEQGKTRQVRDDNQRNKCKINKKRHDAEWGTWYHYVDINSKEEWRKVEMRECIGESVHGGYTCDGISQHVLEWLAFVWDTKTWDLAKAHCESLQGVLFYKLNGTSEQLIFLDERFEGEKFWLGLWTDDYIHWKDMEGQIVSNDLLLWGSNEPSGVEDRIASVGGILFDINWDYLPLNALCDLFSN